MASSSGPRTPLLADTACLQDEAPVDRSVDVIAHNPDNPTTSDGSTFLQRHYGAIVAISAMFVGTLGSSFVSPVLPDIMKDYFGSDERAALISTSMQSAAALLALLIAGVYGRLLDVVGRRPFFLYAFGTNALAACALCAFQSNPLPYMITNAISTVFSATYALAYINDTVKPQHRAVVFAVLEGVQGAAGLAGLAVFGFSRMVLTIFNALLNVAALVIVVVLVRETLPAERVQRFSCDGMHNPLAPLKALLRCKIALGAVVMTFCYIFAEMGTTDVLLFYLNDRIGFTSDDNAIFGAEIAIATPFAYLILVPILTRYLSLVKILLFGVACVGVELAIIATIWTPWMVFAGVGPTTACSVVMVPAILTIVTNSGDEETKGVRLAAWSAVSDLANVAGPLFFGMLYGAMPPKLGWLPFAVSGLALVPMLWCISRVNTWMAEERAAKGEAPTPPAASSEDVA